MLQKPRPRLRDLNCATQHPHSEGGALVPDMGTWGPGVPSVCAAWRAAWIGPPEGEAGRRLQCRGLRTSAVTSRLLVALGFTFGDVLISGHAITSGDGGLPYCSHSTSNHSKWHC